MLAFTLLLAGIVSASNASDAPEDNWAELSRLLRSYDVSPDWRDAHGHSILYLHLLYGSEEVVVRRLRTREAVRTKARMEGGDRLMEVAIRLGSQAVVRTL